MPIRTVGVLAGMTYHSTVPYYTKINDNVQEALGKPNWASLIMHSYSYEEANALFMKNDWEGVKALFIASAKMMQSGGAKAIVLACNAGHSVAKELEAAIDIPLLHIMDAIALAVTQKGLKKVALVGTQVVMEGTFMQERLLAKADGLTDIILPNQDEIVELQRIVAKELAYGLVKDETRAWMTALVKKLQSQGAEAVVLACTDFQFVVSEEDVGKGVLIDTLEEHAKYIANWSINK